ncbi:hypothetical protein [Kluyvera intermedia]|jgi:hypothetical protein|uniref:hypothetical protein n=1 Tax=Kluyvera intermedia TaxID=61648 RepID=UPI0039F5F26A
MATRFVWLFAIILPAISRVDFRCLADASLPRDAARYVKKTVQSKGWSNDPINKKDEPYWPHPHDIYVSFWFCQ